MNGQSVAPAFKKSVAREYLESIVVAVILALSIRTFAVQAFKIPTGSMKYNLLIGDHLLVNKLVYSPSLGPVEDALLGKRPIRRGDVVVFKFPEDPTRDFIKRVIALPGERVEIRNKQVLINGSPLEEDEQICGDERGDEHDGEARCQDADPSKGGPYKVFFRSEDPAYSLRTESIRGNWGPQSVPEGQLLVLGDNRDNSRDGRFWGFLPRDQVKGRALLVYWSYEANGEEYRREGSRDSLLGRAQGLWQFLKDTLSAFGRTRWKRFFHVIR
jgi:signal peptidase I